MPWYLPRLCGANSTEIVQVPPFGAIVSQVLAVTLNGGVAAGAVENEIGAGLSLMSIMLSAELTASTGTGSKLSAFGRAFIFAARPLPPLSSIVRKPNSALLFNCNCPFTLPFATGANATPIVHEARGASVAGQSLEVMTNPVLTVSGPRITVVDTAVLVSVTFADLL